MTEISVPTYQDMLWPTLKALGAMGGSASNTELSERLADLMNLTDDVLDVPHKDGPLSSVDYRAAWSRTHLKFVGAVENSSRGVWAITEIGRRFRSEEEVRRLVKEARTERRRARKGKPLRSANGTDEGEEGEEPQDSSWEENLLTILRELDPSAFERLCQRVLRESGFTKVEVVGRTGDGGIDGTGVLRVKLLSFHVLFQCKRYTGAVSPSEIRDFRGAMVGRTDKGLFLTTGRFTRDAEREAVRDGAPVIDLIDGVGLCHILKSLKLGVRTTEIEHVSPVKEFFDNL